MLTNHLAAALDPFSQLLTKNAVSASYRSLRITPNKVRGYSLFGILEAELSIGIEHAGISVDTASLLSVIKSLPSKADISFQVTKSGNSLEWECGLASGKLAVRNDVVPEFRDVPKKGVKLTKREKQSWCDALELGTLSCGGSDQPGPYGAMLDNREVFTIFSSDSDTIAGCVVSPNVKGFPKQVVISPEAARLLYTVLYINDNDAQIIPSDQGLYITCQQYSLFLNTIQLHKHDLREFMGNFRECDVLAKIPHDRAKAFIKRASALAEVRSNATIELSAAEGALALSFSEGASASDEYYLVDGLEVPDLPSIKLNAGRFAKALAYTDTLGLDHLERGILVLQGMGGSFTYLICGLKQQGGVPS